TFNADGKTDILIRVSGKNIFIGECKFWKGPKAFTSAIDQLLGYAAWRDTKLALVVFNRNRNTTSVVAQIPTLVKAHGSFKRLVPYQRESAFRFLLGASTDRNRELILTVLVFDVPEPDEGLKAHSTTDTL
ncbi:MAG: hypothetical protein IT580_16675, partial [Verrucomicrobiales bacterium]|nr:hypothetical protein [Verrucomicrobiales bacterium]